MIFSNAIMAVAVLCMGAAHAQFNNVYSTFRIAGYEADQSAIFPYIGRDFIQQSFEFIMSDNNGADSGTCDALQLAKDFWDSSDPNEGAYLRSMPTYTGSESDEWGEYTRYYGSSDFHITWVNVAFEQGLNATVNAGLAPQGPGNGKADFYAAFIDSQPTPNTQGVWYPGNRNCIGFEESIKKTTSYVYQFGEIMQLLQHAYDFVNGGCSGCIEITCVNRCLKAVHLWDAAVCIFVGSLEGNGADDNIGGPTGVTLWSLNEKRCANFATCGVTADGDSVSETSSINYAIMRLFAAGRQATFQGEKDQMKVLQRLISNKLAIGGIQGTMRYAWRLSGQGGTRPNKKALTPGLDAPGVGANVAFDKDVAEMGTFAMSILPKVSACSKNAAKLLYAEVAIGGPRTFTLKETATDNSMRPSVNFDNVKLAFECNYKCLGITCEEVGSLFDGQTVNADGSGAPLARSVACKDGKMGTLRPNFVCKRQRGMEKKACRSFVKQPGVIGRDKLEFYINAVGTIGNTNQ